MSRPKARKRLGESIATDPPTRRIYGGEVAQLGALIDFSGRWTDESLSTALCLSLGQPGLASVDELNGRLRRPMPVSESLGSYLADQLGLYISAAAVDEDICNWVGVDAARRMLSLGLLSSPPSVSVDDLSLQQTLLARAVDGARAIPLGWTLADSIAENARAERMSLRELHLGPAYQLTSWEVLRSLAALASVDSASPEITARAAASSLASGICADPESGTAAVLLLLRSSWSQPFDQLSFGSLRSEDSPVGRLVGWIGDLYVWFQLAAAGWSPGYERIREIILPWPFESYDTLIAGAAIANGVDESAPGEDKATPAVEALRELPTTGIERWAHDAALDGGQILKVLDSASGG